MPVSTKMRGELHCYACGYLAGVLEWAAQEPKSPRRLIPALTGPGARIAEDGSLRCGRCDGHLYLDEVGWVWPPWSELSVSAEPNRRRRGRPSTIRPSA